jgi:hypothetical protein
MLNLNKTLHGVDKALHEWGKALHGILEQLFGKDDQPRKTGDDFMKLEPDTRRVLVSLVRVGAATPNQLAVKGDLCLLRLGVDFEKELETLHKSGFVERVDYKDFLDNQGVYVSSSIYSPTVEVVRLISNLPRSLRSD